MTAERGSTTDQWEQVASLAEVGVMAASLLHELRASLFAARGRMELAVARNQPIGPEAAREILGHLNDLDELLGSWGGMSQTDEPTRRFDIHEPVGRALGLMEARRREVGASVVLVPSDISPMILGRPGAIRQVVVNLVQNALDAVEGGPERQIRLSTEVAGSRVRLTVDDSGPGIARDQRERVLEAFVTSKAPGRGTGLGLFLARRLVEGSSGRLLVEESPAGGARMVVDLPAA